MSKKNKFNPQDWVTIKYGEYEGSHGRIAMQDMDGDYKVLPYNSNNEPQALITLAESAIEKIEPLMLSRAQFKDLIRAKKSYSEYADQVFPAFNIRPKTKYSMTADDIREALLNLNHKDTRLEDFKQWFWLIINVFYDYLNIEGRYQEFFFSDTPENDDDIFSIVYGIVEKLYWRLEDRYIQKEEFEKCIVRFDDPVDWGNSEKLSLNVEESAYLVVCDDVISRVDTYDLNKSTPKDKWIFSDSEKRHFITEFETDGDLERASTKDRIKYKHFVLDLYEKGDIEAAKILAWGHYEGNAVFQQDWFLAEKYLLALYDRAGDPFAANSLGYIYYYGRVSCGVPDYEKAFRFFSYGALAGVDESVYKAGDMLMKGLGTVKNIDMGLNLIVDGYRENVNAFCEGHHANKLADYALRMGNACRDNLIYGMGIRDAYKFYLEARLAIRLRAKEGRQYGDDHVERKINYEISKIEETVSIDHSKTSVKTDFPLFITQMFEDKFPVRVYLNVDKEQKCGTLKVEKRKISSELAEKGLWPEGLDALKYFDAREVLVSIPELDLAELTDTLFYRLENISIAQRPERGIYFIADGFKKNDTTNALEFFLGTELVGVVEAKWYAVETKDGKLFRG